MPEGYALMTSKPDKAFILAAGMGTRLRPHTDVMPKPMVSIAGKSIIHRTIAKLKQEGVKEIVINLYYLADVLEEHLKDIQEPCIILSHEDELLDTGGGIKKALSHFDNKPFYIINGDALWDDKLPPALTRLSSLWNDEKMDILMLLEPKDKMIAGFVGDYNCDANGMATRNKDKNGEFMFAGVRIAHPRIFKDSPDGKFSFLSLMDKAQEQQRLYGMVHDDAWYHISTPEDLDMVSALYKKRGI